MTTVQEVTNVLAEFAEDFNITEQGGFIVAKAKTYIKDKEAWVEIARRLRTVKAEWIKDGKNSRWQIPTGTVEANKKLEAESSHLQKAAEFTNKAVEFMDKVVEFTNLAREELKQAGYG